MPADRHLWGRRTVLTGAALVGLVGAGAALAGCTSDDAGGPRPDGPDEPDPDLALAEAVRTDKRELLARYDAVAARFGNLAGRLAPLRADHEAHLLALTAAAPAGGFDATPSPTPGQDAVGDNRGRALSALARVETAAADRRVGQCVSAQDLSLARLIASIGGCEAAHATILIEESA